LLFNKKLCSQFVDKNLRTRTEIYLRLCFYIALQREYGKAPLPNGEKS